MTSTKTQRTCDKGHQYFKSSDIAVVGVVTNHSNTCPLCEKEKVTVDDFLSTLASPARLALLNERSIDTLEKLSKYTEKEILKLHGMGKASMPVLRKALVEKGLGFKQ